MNQVRLGDARWAVRVPASSANLGPGFDVLGMALDLFATLGVGGAPHGAQSIDQHHPAAIAYRNAGGEPIEDGQADRLWVHSPIPAARGLGFSGAMRVGGAALAVVERHGFDALADPAHREEILGVAVALEGHADNAAASLYGGVIAASGEDVVPVSVGAALDVVAWVPDSVTSSTDGSRAALPDTVSRADAVFNIGRVALLVAALAAGDVDVLRVATQDRLHQPDRLLRLPSSAEALAAGVEAGAVAAWLSGSGPTVAMLCQPSTVDAVVAALPTSGHVKHLHIDSVGACVLRDGELPLTF